MKAENWTVMGVCRPLSARLLNNVRTVIAIPAFQLRLLPTIQSYTPIWIVILGIKSDWILNNTFSNTTHILIDIDVTRETNRSSFGAK